MVSMQNSSLLDQAKVENPSSLGIAELMSVDPRKTEQLNSAVKRFMASHSAALESSSLLQKLLGAFARTQSSFHYMNPPLWQLAWRLLTPQQRVTPEFVCTGSIRSGDDLLAHYVMQHPCVPLPLSKEFFPAPIYTDRFIRAQLPAKRDYDALEAKTGVAKAGIFSSIQPSDSWVYWCKALNPNLKFVICLRDPVERTISHWNWNHMISRSVVTDPLWDLMPGLQESMNIEIEQVPNGGCGFHFHCGVGATSYLRHSIYLPFIRQLHRVFGEDSVLILDSEDLHRSPIATMQGVYNFLGLPDYVPTKSEASYRVPESYRNRIEEDTVREGLEEFFKPYNEALFAYLGRRFQWSGTQQEELHNSDIKPDAAEHLRPMELVGWN